VRKATRKDSASFLRLVLALAKFESLEPPGAAAKRRLVEDVFAKKRINLLIAESDRAAVGYALYYFSYSSFLARPTLYLEDLFVLESARGQGVGKSLFLKCVKEAVAAGCGRMEWAVLKWNERAIGFYEGMGAKRLDEWHFYRLDSETLRRLTSR